MSKDAKNLLGVPEAADKTNKSSRKMTQAILEDQEKDKEVYEFLEDDDDFEEFENDELDYADILGDVEMDAGDSKKGEEYDRKLWHQDWDDEEQHEDFLVTLRGEIKR